MEKLIEKITKIRKQVNRYRCNGDIGYEVANNLNDLTAEAINHVHSSLLLKEKHKISFEDWLIKFFRQIDECNYIDRKTDELFDKEDLYVKYLWMKENL